MIILFRLRYMFQKLGHWRTVTADSSYHYGKKKKGSKVNITMRTVLQSGCLQSWGFWGRWWIPITPIYRKALRRKSKTRSFRISPYHLQITAATPSTIMISTTVQLGFVLIATQLRLLFGGVVLEVPRYSWISTLF